MNYKLIAFDMDDTLLSGRTIYVIADRKGFRDEVDRIISMEIPNYKKTIEIAKLLEGMSVEEFLEIFRSIPLNDNVPEVFDEIRKKKIKTAIISNSYDIAAKDLAERLKIDFVIANELIVKDGIITGVVIPHNKNPVDKIGDCRSYSVCKSEALEEICRKLNIDPSETIAIGDGSIDRFMLSTAGLGIAYRPKANLEEYADVVIDDMIELLRFL